MSAETPDPSIDTTPSSASPEVLKFTDLALSAPLLRALNDVGYESPSPIQAATIPPLLAGRDVLGQAQTGTGKTAAFALPILAQIDPKQFKPQALVLAPTRELAIQVAEAFQKYAVHLPGFHVLPIYGGQGYAPQLQALKRGVHVVVGTPGRVIDHLDRGTLDLSQLRCLVLDEADEMLRMGFIDDVENVLKKTPATRQVALFSATMPHQIKRIAQTYLKDPVEIAIKATTATTPNIRQRYWSVSGVHKLDALTRILEAEPFEAMIVFARTKIGTEELAEKLAARGLSVAAINGDVQQAQREKTIQNLKDGKIDILVATDVAARGLDVERISHVLNYDIPNDTESYVHRIGRTGRAGRKGEAILFVTPRERGMLRAIERATRQPIEVMELPSVEAVNDQRVTRFLGRISTALEGSDLGMFREMIERYEREQNVPAVEIAAALAKLVQGDSPLLLSAATRPAFEKHDRDAGPREHRGAATRKFVERDHAQRDYPAREQAPREHAPREHASREPAVREHRPEPRAPREAPRTFDERNAPPARHAERQFTPPVFSPATPARNANAGESFFDDDAPAAVPRAPRERDSARTADVGMQTFRIEVGHSHGVQPGNIVGAIANEADLESRYIGRIDIRDEYSLVDLPEGMPPELMEHLKKVYVAGQPLRIRHAAAEDSSGGRGQRPHGSHADSDSRPPPRSARAPFAGKPGASARPPFKPRPPRAR